MSDPLAYLTIALIGFMFGGLVALGAWLWRKWIYD